MKVLISAYACEPGRGSEPGVGWNWVTQMSKYHEVWVITRANNQKRIEDELSKNPIKNLHFVYFDLPRWARWWKKGIRGVQLYYFLWQIFAYPLAKRLHEEIGFDLAHHVTFATFRQPSFLAFLPIPFIWGPVAGGDRAPIKLYMKYGLKIGAFKIARDLYSFLCRLSPLVRLTMKKANLILVTTDDTKKMIPKKYHSKTLVYPTIGIERTELNDKIPGKLNSKMLGEPKGKTSSESNSKMYDGLDNKTYGKPKRDHGTFKVLYVGRLAPWKGANLALESFIKFHERCRNSTMTIIGEGPEEKRLIKLVQEAGLQNIVKFTGSLDRKSALDAYMDHDVLLFPSFHDSGGMVVLEAMAACIPVVCLALGGPDVSVAEGCGFKIKPQNYDRLVNEIAYTLHYIYNNPDKALENVLNARKRLEEYYLWDRKSEFMQKLYLKLYKESKEPYEESYKESYKESYNGSYKESSKEPFKESYKKSCKELNKELYEKLYKNLYKDSFKDSYKGAYDILYERLNGKKHEKLYEGLYEELFQELDEESNKELDKNLNKELNKELHNGLHEEPSKTGKETIACNENFPGNTASFKIGVVNINKYTSIYVPLKNRKAIYNSFELLSCSNRFKRIYKNFIRTAAVILKKNPLTFRGYKTIQLKNNIKSLLAGIKDFAFFSLYTGTPGHYRKYTLQLLSEKGSVIGYAKIPRTEAAKEAIRNEYKSLEYLKQLKLENSIIPEIILYSDKESILVQSGENGLKKSPIGLDDAVIASLSELHNRTKKTMKLYSNNIFAHIEEMASSNYEKVKRMAESGNKLIEQLRNLETDFSFAHRDFTPWNTKRKDGKLYIFDWEFSKLSIPYFDIFHYIYLAEILVKKSSKEKIYKIILNNQLIDVFESLTGLTGRMDMFKLYLLETAYFYYKADILDGKDLREDKILNFTLEMFEYLVK